MLDELSKGTAVYTLRDIDKLEQNRNWTENGAGASLGLSGLSFKVPSFS